ncbi:putative ER membrane protein complex subunit 3 [Apostichopus japonicus]|uniref:Putative ER membrane protein complex subunit 3 n=1 Tax=Stichopus japonicus TaxID=307972 RepID=A0A2G8L2J2_STIJA|nr:putative ER membrane protein complex subunit 3 [Apostichopus japonicus]
MPLSLAADQTRLMQQQMAQPMAMAPDPAKAFKAEWETLEIVDHKWMLANVEDELIGNTPYPSDVYVKNKYQ